MAQSFRFVVYGVRKGIQVDPTTGTAEKPFSDLRKGYAWVVSVSKYPDNPVYSVHTWSETEGRLWAVTIQPDWSYRFVCC